MNALAEASDGFVWRLQSEAGDATSFSIYGESSYLVNMSVWDSLESLLQFVRSKGHMAIMKRRREWFEPPDQPNLVLWWVRDGHHPTIEEAAERLTHLREHGSSPHAFSPRDGVPPPP